MYMDSVGDNFISTGFNQSLPIKIGFDWFESYNETAIQNQVNNAVTHVYWRRNMLLNDCIMEYFNAGSTAILQAKALNFPGGAKPGIIEYSSGNNAYINNYSNLLAPIAITAISNAAAPLVTTGDTHT